MTESVVPQEMHEGAGMAGLEKVPLRGWNFAGSSVLQ
jgi:hypothetical protein